MPAVVALGNPHPARAAETGPVSGVERREIYCAAAGFVVGRNRRGRVEMRFSAVALVDGEQWWWSTRRVCDPAPYRFRRGRRLNVLRIDEWRASRKRRRDGEPIWATLTGILAEWTRACDQLRRMGATVHQVVGNMLYDYRIATAGTSLDAAGAAAALQTAVSHVTEQDSGLAALTGARPPRSAVGKVSYDEWGYPVGVTGLEERYAGRTVAAVDASKLEEGVDSAIFGAVVNSRGWCRVRQFPRARTSTRAEKEALRWALTVLKRREGEPVPLLLADSADTVSGTPAPRGGRGRAVVRWVPGHLGHPLNEAAHHLAFGANRAFMEGRLDEFHRQVRPRLAAEAKRQWQVYAHGGKVTAGPYRRILESAGLLEKGESPGVPGATARALPAGGAASGGRKGRSRSRRRRRGGRGTGRRG